MPVIKNPANIVASLAAQQAEADQQASGFLIPEPIVPEPSTPEAIEDARSRRIRLAIDARHNAQDIPSPATSNPASASKPRPLSAKDQALENLKRRMSRKAALSAPTPEA